MLIFLLLFYKAGKMCDVKASKRSSSTNSLFTQRAQESPLATSVLVYLPSVPSYDCHDNDLVAMPIFQCYCVFMPADCTFHLLLFLISSDSSSHPLQYIMWDSYYMVLLKFTHTHTHAHSHRCFDKLWFKSLSLKSGGVSVQSVSRMSLNRPNEWTNGRSDGWLEG